MLFDKKGFLGGPNLIHSHIQIHTSDPPTAILTPFVIAYHIACENAVFNGIRCQEIRFFHTK